MKRDLRDVTHLEEELRETNIRIDHEAAILSHLRDRQVLLQTLIHTMQKLNGKTATDEPGTDEPTPDTTDVPETEEGEATHGHS